MGEQFLARVFGAIAVLVTAVWLIGYLAPIWRENYTPAPELNIVMMAIVGIFVSLYNKAKSPNEDEPQGNRSEPQGNTDDRKDSDQ